MTRNPKKSIWIQDYVLSNTLYSPELTYGMITQKEIEVLFERLKESPHYILKPRSFSFLRALYLLMFFTAFCLFFLAFFLLSINQIIPFSPELCFAVPFICFIIFLLFGLFLFYCSKIQKRKYLSKRDIFFDEIIKDTNNLYASRGVKFYYNESSPDREVIIFVTKPNDEEMARRAELIYAENNYLATKVEADNAEMLLTNYCNEL